MPDSSTTIPFTQIFTAITNSIIAYEPGDVMTMSEIITNLESLLKKCSKKGIDRQLCRKLLDVSKEELRNSSAGFSSYISEGLDLL